MLVGEAVLSADLLGDSEGGQIAADLLGDSEGGQIAADLLGIAVLAGASRHPSRTPRR